MTSRVTPVPGFTGDAIYPDSPGYDTARQVFNGLIDKRPAVLLRCHTLDDIVAAVRYAVESGAQIAVRGGGHSVAGHSSTDGGVVIDLSAMRGVQVDPQRRIAMVEPGATWADVDRATTAHGLACPGGVVSTTGVGGFTLGGGIGWLSRAYGLTCDNLVGADVVAPTGEVLTVSETDDPEVLWGLRGGGGNFGVVARFVLRLHPVDEVVAGVYSYADTEADTVLRHFRDRMDGAPDHLAAILDFSTDITSGRNLVNILGCSTRTDATGQNDVDALLTVPAASTEPAVALRHTLRYATWQQVIDQTAPFGWLNYWKSVFLTELSDEAIRRISLLGRARPTAQTRLHLIRLGGVAGRVAPEATAIATRTHPYIIHLMTTWTDPADTERCRAWAGQAYEILRPLGPSSAYLNFVGDEGQERIRASFGDETYRRLAALKARLDPTNRFALNHNIEPAAPTAV
ncbi:FAD-binding oxidoreductase [Mycobacterium koreense]|uniref:FAD-linked oxidoreductase n=1 Tax=Mycolicibacillus koreensis TaxID=1069220 RepID=A0A7I7SE75_9MYCO|nr:FAD-binding oxidoreductase [Mycolicibacillus koreensis]MCV7248152.1 FAD-binding oxidoreductase [Mycolicibacillus koreensis]OSC35734.1 FAD-linked oxidoreductase [Mycolicibacillus koreensis]BBY55088.1 FAD-linked oxidase [Mycolicibacillus koreensis]